MLRKWIRGVLMATAMGAIGGSALAADGAAPDLTGFYAQTGEFKLPPGAYLGKVEPGAKFDPTKGSKVLKNGGDDRRMDQVPAGLKYTPEAWKKVLELRKNVQYDPAWSGTACMPLGLPRSFGPMQIIQRPDMVAILYESPQTFRVIPTDGRPHNPDADSSYMGDSVGHWEGDTLVVDVTNFNDTTWFGTDGLHHTDKLHVTERWRLAGDVLTYEAKVEDPGVLAEPWVYKAKLPRAKGEVISEVVCVDNNSKHFADKKSGFH